MHVHVLVLVNGAGELGTKHAATKKMLFLLIFALVFVLFWTIFYATGPALSRALTYAAHRTAAFRYLQQLARAMRWR